MDTKITVIIDNKRGKPASEIRDIARALDSMEINLICTEHCTKERAYRIMKKEF